MLDGGDLFSSDDERSEKSASARPFAGAGSSSSQKGTTHNQSDPHPKAKDGGEHAEGRGRGESIGSELDSNSLYESGDDDDDPNTLPRPEAVATDHSAPVLMNADDKKHDEAVRRFNVNYGKAMPMLMKTGFLPDLTKVGRPQEGESPRSGSVRSTETRPKSVEKFLKTLPIVDRPAYDAACAEVARFLRSTVGLNRENVGEWLGSPDVINLDVLTAYCMSFKYEFEGKDVEKCLRKLLTTFKIPGEAQKIERVMEAFGTSYAAANPNAFRGGGDTALVLGYSHPPSLPRIFVLAFCTRILFLAEYVVVECPYRRHILY